MKIIAKEIYLRNVRESDAEFIIQIRCNPKNSKYISKTSLKVDDQKSWIREYKKREKKGKEVYLIGCSKDGVRFGTSRLYSFEGDTFVNGSWVVLPGTNPRYSILLEVLTRCYAFNEMGFEKCFFDVRKKNIKVINYHQMFSATLEYSNNLSNFYSIQKQDYFHSLNRFLKYNIISEEDIRYTVSD